MRKSVIVLLIMLLLAAIPFSSLAASWPASPYFPQQIEFRHDHKYNRYSTFTGPEKIFYSSAGTYLNSNTTSIMALWKEAVDGGNYLYIEFRCQPAYFRRVYVQNTYFSSTVHIPSASLTPLQSSVTQTCTAYYGPGTEYNRLENSSIESGTRLQVFFEENGYVFAEFFNGMGRVRAYISSDCVAESNSLGN